MFKIIEITDKEGNTKNCRMKEIIEKHGSAYGEFFYELSIGVPFYFIYRDDKEKCLRSSKVECYDYIEESKMYVIVTANSVYYIVEAEEE